MTPDSRRLKILTKKTTVIQRAEELHETAVCIRVVKARIDNWKPPDAVTDWNPGPTKHVMWLDNADYITAGVDLPL